MLKKQYEDGLSKEEMKKKYLDMLENDPYRKAAQGKTREFQGAHETIRRWNQLGHVQ